MKTGQKLGDSAIDSKIRKWREKGDHEYMNRMASGGHLYQVRRER